MNKLSLNVEQLEVESFDTADSHRGREGTVHAHATAHGGPCHTVDPCRPSPEPQPTGWITAGCGYVCEPTDFYCDIV